jgi:peptidyl-prolyl cis-trans isomerase C
MSARVCAALGVITLASCGGQTATPPRVEALGGDVAQVDDVRIPGTLVSEVAGARGATPREAVDGLIEDALAARGARAQGLDRAPEVEWASTAALARAATLRFQLEAARAGPPKDEELATITVQHALVQRKPSLPPPRALRLAREVASAVASARDAKDFEARAKSVAGVAEWLRVEDLPGFDLGGDSAEGAHFDSAFVAAAFALQRPGDTSGVVESPFGWHVIRLVSRELPTGAMLEERRSRLADTVVVTRARGLVEASVAARLHTEAIEVSGAADALMALTQQPSPSR